MIDSNAGTFMRNFLAVAALLASMPCAAVAQDPAPGAAPQKRTLSIGTGGLSGVYYPAGGAIAIVVNKGSDVHGLHAVAQPTEGSVSNVNAVLDGSVEFGIVQADRQFQAVNGQADWKDVGPRQDLMAICSLHAESITLVAAEDADIRSLADLRGKRVNIGEPGSGNRGNAIDVLHAAGLDWQTDVRAAQVKPSKSARLLQNGKIDAYFYTVGHPNASVREATTGARPVRFVPIVGIDQLVRKQPYYSATVVPIEHYPDAVNQEDVPTFGVKATLVASANLPADAAYAVSKAIFENLDELKSLLPALAGLTKEHMLEGNAAPFHPGALKYYQEAGLIP